MNKGAETVSDDMVIVGAKRTPIGSFQGQFNTVSCAQLGAAAIAGALAEAGIDAEAVDEVIMGCVLPAGQGQAPARQAAIYAGIPLAAGATTVNKMCGSGMKAMMQGCDAVMAGSAGVVIAGGMESMTNAPYLLPKARGGLRMGHGEILDHMFFDGLQDPYENYMMGEFAERCAGKYEFTREAQDAFTVESTTRASRAIESGEFAAEITPVTVKSRRGDSVAEHDEEPGRMLLDKIPTLRPAFRKDGTVTAATSSKISDGAAATVLMTADKAAELGAEPLARIVAQATHSQEPGWFTTAPVGAIARVLDKAGWAAADVDLFEVNEAFAVVTMAAMAEHGLDHAKVNVNGGACALGHPIGASGARIVVTLINALRQRGLKKGVAALCIGGGEATAMAIELA
jgi:acetyl-CoA C-acetyltransferase